MGVALLVGACTTPSPRLVDRQPDASLLLPCVRPKPPSLDATDRDIALGYVDAVQRYLECEARHQALVNFVTAGRGGEAE